MAHWLADWPAGCCCCFYISEVSDVSDAARAAADGQPVNVIYWTDGRRPVAEFQLPLFKCLVDESFALPIEPLALGAKPTSHKLYMQFYP